MCVAKREFCSLVHRYFAQCFTCEEAPRVHELADCLGISTRTLRRRTEEYCGVPPGVLLRAFRRRHARSLMRRTNLTTTSIAYCAGYGSRRTLYRAFRRETGLSPRQHDRESQRL